MAEAEQTFQCTLVFYSPVEIDEDEIRSLVEEGWTEELIPYTKESEDWGMSITHFSCDRVNMKSDSEFHQEYPKDGWEPPGNREAPIGANSGCVQTSSYELGIDFGMPTPEVEISNPGFPPRPKYRDRIA